MRKYQISIVILVVVLVVLAVATSLYFSLWGGKHARFRTYKIGVSVPLSGGYAGGEATRKGVLLAQKDRNSSNIKLVFVDSKCDPAVAISKVNQLIFTDSVDAIIGDICSGATLAVAPIANSMRVPMISPASTNPDISQAGDYVFRTVPSDSQQGKFGAEMVYSTGGRKLSVVYSNEPYGIGFLEILTRQFGELGGEIVTVVPFEKDIEGSIEKAVRDAMSDNPDSIYLISNKPANLVEAVQEINKSSDHPAIYGTEAALSSLFIENASLIADGMMASALPVGDQQFRERFEEEYGISTPLWAAQAYDAFSALDLAIQKSEETDLSLQQALFNIDFQGVTGNIIFDSNGDVAGNYEIVEFRDGKFEKL